MSDPPLNGRVVESGMYLRLPCIQRNMGHNHQEVLACERDPHNVEERYAVRILNIHCRKYLMCFIFVVAQAYEKLLTLKIS